MLLDYGAENLYGSSCLSQVNECLFDKLNVNLIDFGFASSYIEQDDSGRLCHIQKGYKDLFQGNILFSSLNQLKFKRTSRRDDLISLFYLMVYLLKGAKMPGYNDGDSVPKFSE